MPPNDQLSKPPNDKLPEPLEALRKELEPIARERKLIPLVGPGASSSREYTCPTWLALYEKLIDEARALEVLSAKEESELRKTLKTEDHPYVAAKLRFTMPSDNFRDVLLKEYDPPSIAPNALHAAIIALRSPIILTTNYDTLLEDQFADLKGLAADLSTYRQSDSVRRTIQDRQDVLRRIVEYIKPIINRLGDDITQDQRAEVKAILDRYNVGTSLDRFEVEDIRDTEKVKRAIQDELYKRPVIFKIYGSIRQSPDIILSERDFKKRTDNGTRELPDLLSNIFLMNTVLLIGFSPSDLGLKTLLKILKTELQYHSDPEYILISTNEADRDKKSKFEGEPIDFKEYKIRAIEATDENILSLMKKLGTLANPETETHKKRTK